MLFIVEPRAHQPQQTDNEHSLNACDQAMVSSAETVFPVTAVVSDDLLLELQLHSNVWP